MKWKEPVLKLKNKVIKRTKRITKQNLGGGQVPSIPLKRTYDSRVHERSHSYKSIFGKILNILPDQLFYPW